MHEAFAPFDGIESWPRERVENELAIHAVRIAAAIGEYLHFLGELDRRQQLPEGFLTLPNWLSWRIGMDLDTAREHVRVARALREFPRTSKLLREGKLSYSKARAITRSERPELENALLDLAVNATASQTEKAVRKLRKIDPKKQAEKIEERRSFSTHIDDDGMLVLHARLAPEEGALLKKALDAARQELFKTAAEGSHADAFVHMVQRSLNQSGDADERNMVVVHVDADDLKTAAEGTAAIEGGPAVPAESARRLACDSTIVELTDGKAGRKSRVLSPTLRRALSARDEGTCQFPGCHHRVVDAHHIVHWADGGPTELSNLTTLCRRHHVLVHELGYRVELVDNRARFYHPNGSEVLDAPPLPNLPITATEPTEPDEDEDALAAQDYGPLDYDWILERFAERLT